ncbi:hypothetical protein [Massilia glaciei]|uniref:Uncharacterized protein n=1 Tax=Massilia glaciei TaxID=1524097 RepID=A0A2U2HFN7_9BURK|nr:hypothetical protein [Massilia glaciei]PWF43134.1 hypothetical protein C7C56_021575 [Massilia glaciei]
MKNLVFMLFLAVSPVASGADGCTFDQAEQEVVLKRAALRHPGGTLALKQRHIQWSEPGGWTSTFTYGGCHHFGAGASLAQRSAAAMTRLEVMATAIALAQRFWNKRTVGDTLALETLSKNVGEARYTVEKAGGSTVYRVIDPAFAELSVEHSHENGIDLVRIAWIGNY